MATVIIYAGEQITLADDESFNKARHRLNQAKKLIIDYKNGAIDGENEKFEPFHLLSFKTADGGRFSIDPEKVIGLYSTEDKD